MEVKLATMNSTTVPVLDKGYVRLIDHMGSDLSVVNAARASYMKEVDELSPADARLIGFLMKEGHYSPFRHAFLTFEVKAPVLTARHIFKYIVGSAHTDPMIGWNESCIAGDEEILSFDGKRFKIRDLAEMSNNDKHLPGLRSMMPDGSIVENNIKNVWKTGETQVYEVVSELGFKVKTTNNHRFLTPNGYKELKDLGIGNEVMMNGVECYRDKIIEINLVGVSDVYDIEMVDEPNFVINQFIVHNSRRYVTSDEEFYEPKADEWRSKPENSKQGSGEPVDEFTGSFYTDAFKRLSEEGLQLYHAAMESGICAEQARIFLPAYSLYVTWRWSCSLQGLIHFLDQRLADDAQLETQKYARAIHRLSQPLFPITFAHAELSL